MGNAARGLGHGTINSVVRRGSRTSAWTLHVMDDPVLASHLRTSYDYARRVLASSGGLPFGDYIVAVRAIVCARSAVGPN